MSENRAAVADDLFAVEISEKSADPDRDLRPGDFLIFDRKRVGWSTNGFYALGTGDGRCAIGYALVTTKDGRPRKRGVLFEGIPMSPSDNALVYRAIGRQRPA